MVYAIMPSYAAVDVWVCYARYMVTGALADAPIAGFWQKPL